MTRVSHHRAGPRTLVIGVGNEDRGDDAVGLLVARRVRLLSRGRCDVVECRGSMASLLDMWGRSSRVVLVDAMPGMHPGRWHRVGAAGAESLQASASSHGFGVGEVIGLARALDVLPESLLVYAVEGEDFRTGSAVSAPVAAVVEAVARRVLAEAA